MSFRRRLLLEHFSHFLGWLLCLCIGNFPEPESRTFFDAFAKSLHPLRIGNRFPHCSSSECLISLPRAFGSVDESPVDAE